MRDPREQNWPAHFADDQLANVIEMLPPPARRRYEILCRKVEDGAALVAVSQERIGYIEAHLVHAQNHLAQLTQFPLSDPKDAPLIEAAKAEVERIQADMESAIGERTKRDSVRSGAQQVVGQLRNFLMTMPLPVRSVRIEAKPTKGETLPDAIDRVRSAIRKTAGEIAMTKAAPPDRATVEHQLRDHVQSLVRAGTPSVRFDADRVLVDWPDANKFGHGAPPGSASKLLAAMFPDQVLAFLMRGIDQLQGIPPSERANRIAKLEADIRKLEHEEESFIAQAEAQGLEVFRRPFASGYALLAIDPVTDGEQLVAAE